MTPSQAPTRPAWRWAVGWSLALLLLSCIPYLIAIFLAPENWHFAGILVNPYDGHSYLAKMRQGFDGNWLFHLAFTHEPHDGAFIFIFYLALGHLARLTHLPLILVFHLARLLAGFLLLLTAFRFIIQVTPYHKEQRLAFILLLTASGLGWLGVMFGAFSIDLWVPEAFVPYSIYANPHFPLGMALMLVILQAVVWPGNACITIKAILITGLASLALALILPFALMTIWAVLVVYLIGLYLQHRRWPWPQLWLTMATIVWGVPVIFYDYWVSQINPILAGWSAQNLTPAPPILDLILGYGLVGGLAVLGGWLVVRKGMVSGEALVLLWAIVTLTLVYFPFFDLQRRLINGLHIPLCILAAIGLIRWLDSRSLKQHHRQIVINSVVLVGIIGTLFVWIIPLLGLLQSPTKSETTALFFVRSQEVSVFNWLRENSNQTHVLLASPRFSLFAPGQTGSRVFYGHPFETIEADTKKTIVETFYRGEISTITPLPNFIVYGPSEKAIGQPQNLDQYPVVYTYKDITVYKPQ